MLSDKDTAELIDTVKNPEIEMSLSTIVDVLQEAMDARDELKAQLDARTQALRYELEKISTPWKEKIHANDLLLSATKQRGAAILLAAEDLKAQQIAARVALTEPLEIPNGLRVKQSVEIQEIDENKLPENFFKAVVDREAVENAIAEGESIQGVTTALQISISLNRAALAKMVLP